MIEHAVIQIRHLGDRTVGAETREAPVYALGTNQGHHLCAARLVLAAALPPSADGDGATISLYRRPEGRRDRRGVVATWSTPGINEPPWASIDASTCDGLGPGDVLTLDIAKRGAGVRLPAFLITLFRYVPEGTY